MDYKGTSGNDDIDQAIHGLPDGTNIYGGAGDDTITVRLGNALGEAGNDTIIGLGPIGNGNYAGATYWNSPAGVRVNLATGKAEDGFGGTDTLRNIYVVQDSQHDDHITGSTASEDFWLIGGSNTVIGGGGRDSVLFYDVKSTDVTVSHDAATGTFKLLMKANGAVNTLTGISRINFVGPNSDNATITQDMFDYSAGFLRARSSVASFDMNRVLQMRAADFNGDGKLDLLAVRGNPDLGLTTAPLQIMIGDGAGNFTDQTASLFGGEIPQVNWVPRIFATDFNNDGRADIFAPDFGLDTAPYPGGQNALFLSNAATGRIENATATLPQGLRGNHGTAVGDINRDGYADLLVNSLHETTGNANQLLVNDGTGHFVVSQHLLPASLRPSGYDAGYTWSMMRDLNNDGYDDIVLGTWEPKHGPSLVVLNDGHGSFANSTPVALPYAGLNPETVMSIETMDLNGDALPDLVLSVTNDGPHDVFYRVPYIQLLVNEGNGQFRDETATRLPQSKVANSVEHNWYLSITPVDLDGDGDQDLVADGVSSAPSRTFMNDGAGNFTLGWEGALGSHVVVLDANGDGKPDLVETSNAGYSVLFNAFPNRVPASGEYRAGDTGERIAGGAAKETIYSGKGDDSIDAGAGLDTVVYSGERAQFTVAKAGDGFTVSGPQGTDTLAQVERLAFGDVSIALDIDGVAGQAYRVYEAAFNRTADNGGLGYWIDTMDKGATLAQIAVGFVQSEEFQAKFAGKSNAEIVNEFYSNILNRAGEPAGTAWWIDQLNGGNATLAEVLVGFSEAAENKANLVGVTQNGIEFNPWD